MDDSDERLMLLVCAIAFWFVGGGLAAAMYFKIHAVVNLLFVIAFFNVALIVSYGSEHVEGLDRAKWFWCPLTLLFPYLVPFILYFFHIL